MTIPTPSKRIRFGMFEADLRSGELRKQGIKIKLHHQPFEVLAVLLEHPGEVVTREELKNKLWPFDTFVDFDVGLNSAVKKLRDALGDSAEIPRYVETLPRRGYRFIGSLSDASTSKTDPLSALPEPVVEEQSSAASERGVTRVPAVSGAHSRWMLWATVATVVAVLLLLVGLNAGRLRQRLLARATPVHIRSIAVLPLENLTGDPAQDYFVDGMTDALITDLAQISSLRVISRTSVMRYKGTRKPLPEIAKELNVDGIVEGAVVRSGERVRVDAQLIQATTDQHFWARSYERSPGDVIALQGEVARAVADEIQVQLTPQEQTRLARTQSVDPQTYEFYLKGRYFWGKRTEDSIRRSIDYFQQAIQRDPNYAPAYAAMAEAYVTRSDFSPAEHFSKVKAAARRALEIDQDVAEAHNALAMSFFAYDWDWPEAEKEFQRALGLNPSYAQAHQWYGQFLRAMRRQNYSAEIQRAHELDPLSLVTGGGSGQYGTQYDRIIEAQRKKMELDPNSPVPYGALAAVYNAKGMYQEAITYLQKAVSLSGGEPGYLTSLGYTYGIAGKRDEAQKILEQVKLVSKRRYVSPYDIARVYVGLRERNLAFDWLGKAVANHDVGLGFLTGGADTEEMASISSDPRYAQLKRRIGLPQ